MNRILRIQKGPDAGKEFALPDSGHLVLGRGTAAGFRLNDDQVSRAHARIVVGPDGPVLSDLESRNGTFLNGRKITTPEALRPGDLFQVGNTVMAVVHPEGGEPTVETEFFRASEIYFCLSCGVRTSPPCRRCGAAFLIPVDGIEGYVLDRRLGAGGMGVVFLARRSEDELPVAVKIFSFIGEPRREGLKRFFREAKIPAALKHANIVEVLGTGAAQGRPPKGCLPPGQKPCKAAYIVLEFVQGRDLTQVVSESGPMGLKPAISIGIVVSDVLQAAFEAGIVHRDIKPHNIMLTGQGVVKVMDFGLSKSFEDAGLSGVTKTGFALGTPNFMAPEQIRDARYADHRADIYALGATLFFILSGKLPFEGKRIREVLTKVLDEPPPSLASLRPDLPHDLPGVIARTLEKKPDARYGTAKELKAELERILADLH